MSDNVGVLPSSSPAAITVATDELGGIHYPIYKDFYIDVAAGNVAGHSIVNKFGQNDDLNTTTYEDIWDGGATYTYPADATAPITHVDSSDAADTGLVEVQGLDVNGDLVVQSATLTGTTPVLLTTALWRVFRLKNTGTANYVGTVQAVNTADNVVYARILIGNNQTLMALYTVPNNKTGYLFQFNANMSLVTRAVSASGRRAHRPFGGVFQLKDTFGVGSDGGSHGIELPLYERIAGKTDIKISAISSASGAAMNARFSLLLVDD